MGAGNAETGAGSAREERPLVPPRRFPRVGPEFARGRHAPRARPTCQDHPGSQGCRCPSRREDADARSGRGDGQGWPRDQARSDSRASNVTWPCAPVLPGHGTRFLKTNGDRDRSRSGWNGARALSFRPRPAPHGQSDAADATSLLPWGPSFFQNIGGEASCSGDNRHCKESFQSVPRRRAAPRCGSHGAKRQAGPAAAVAGAGGCAGSPYAQGMVGSSGLACLNNFRGRPRCLMPGSG